MATLIPSLSTCASRMTTGERRVAQRLEDKLDDDYLLWYDVPMGPKNAHPDFCVIALERDPQLVQPRACTRASWYFPGAMAWCLPTSPASSLKRPNC